MYKKLDDNSINKLLETAIDEFAEHGLERASMSTIAKKAGVSVGVIYKYYGDKDGFFLACVRHSLELLDSTVSEALEGGGDLHTCLRRLVRGLIRQSKEHANYNAMYNEITSGSCRRYADVLASEIETRTAKIYKKVFEHAGLEQDVNPAVFAFFFDNLLMMLQFSYSCDYYKHRMKIFCGEEIMNNDEIMEEMFIKFLDGVMKGEACNT